MKEKKRLVILASGGGSNAAAIMNHFVGHEEVDVVCVVSNKAHAAVLEKANRQGVNTLVFSREQMKNDDALHQLKELKVDLLVLAGFLWLIPASWVEAFPNRIINIHPSLLPKYGGKGMYGMHVHNAVKAAGERSSGMTVHVVNERFDEGPAVFQASTLINQTDSVEEIAAKVLKLEHQYYPVVIEQYLKNAL